MPPRKRESKAKQQCKLMCCTTPPEAVERIREDLEQYRPGLWAEVINYGPACSCGLRAAKGVCHAHPKENDNPGPAGG